MAVYKVPQDVEADDKLIGPFSFRQFIYLIIVALAGGGAWGLSQLFLPLMMIPIPVIIFFGALALPLKKDQPMEVYLAAVVSFYLKPRKKLWEPDGINSLIEITAPKTDDTQLIKDLSQEETRRRLSYLANVVDSRGWAVRGIDVTQNSPLNNDVIYEAEQANDVMDDLTTIQSLDAKLNQSNEVRHKNILDVVNHKQDFIPVDRYSQIPVSISNDTSDYNIKFNPYPNIQQSVIQPFTKEDFIPTDSNTSKIIPPADIINLASNSDLSVETIAREANRIKENHKLDQEVVISLR